MIIKYGGIWMFMGLDWIGTWVRYSCMKWQVQVLGRVYRFYVQGLFVFFIECADIEFKSIFIFFFCCDVSICFCFFGIYIFFFDFFWRCVFFFIGRFQVGQFNKMFLFFLVKRRVEDIVQIFRFFFLGIWILIVRV